MKVTNGAWIENRNTLLEKDRSKYRAGTGVGLLCYKWSWNRKGIIMLELELEKGNLSLE